MKKLLLILLCLPVVILAQQTYVPDDNFEAYLETHNNAGILVSFGDSSSMGNGIWNDDSVITSKINTATFLSIGYQNISDLTGIEDFISLMSLSCGNNQLTSLDVSYNNNLFALDCCYNQITNLDLSQNTNLEYLYCFRNQINTLDLSNNTLLIYLWCNNNNISILNVNNNTSLLDLRCYNNEINILDISQNTNLIELQCSYNQLTNLDVSQNTALNYLTCYSNQLTSLNLSDATSLSHLECWDNELISLDLSQNNSLIHLDCNNNNLSILDLRNSNNSNFLYFRSITNMNLYCINVDDSTWSASNWTNIDSWTSFDINCQPPSSIEEHTTNKELFKVTDLLGRETKKTNQPLLYIYDDGTVEKRIVIE